MKSDTLKTLAIDALILSTLFALALWNRIPKPKQ
jgi:hypothetical protein